MSAAWKRQLTVYMPGKDGGVDIIAVYAEEALTGFVGYIEKPVIGDFNGAQCVCVPLATWILLKTMANETVTPFRIVAHGKNLIEKGWMPHTGLKHAVRNEAPGPCVMIPVKDFNPVK